ncbi:unnamed protein product [Tuber aestivum]|uniref:Ubiquitin-like protease family profile domain-containing protein n=1 Tax=Tuber aestivum TaxID=59557 RepID=A0A292PPI7_9PEZI|nr:unnamed protein product [Tuber aestivum]
MADIVLAGHAERFRRQMDTHLPGASAELIAANRVATELQWNRGINKFIIALDENGQGFIKGLELPPRVHQNYMSTCVNSTNIFNARPSSAILPNFAYLEIDNQPPIFWFQRRRPDLGQEDRIMSTSKHNFYGPTPWVIQEPLCTEAIALSTPANLPPITGIIRLLGNDLNFTPAMVAARATRFGQWSLENYTTDDFDREENLQPTPRLPDPRGLEPTGWLTSDIMDAVTTHYNQFHPEAEIFSVSLTALLVVTGDPSHLAQSRLGARFWIFIQSNVQANHPGNHWWISIVDRVKGHLFSHNSLRNLGDPSILFDVLKPIFESPVVQNIAGSAATLTLPANTVVDVPQQQNGYDCGVYSVRTLTGFLEELAQIQGPVPTDGESQAARSYIPENWSSTEYRGALRNSFPIRPLQGANASTTLKLLNNLITALSHANHHHDLERAMWHLDNAGGILLQMNSLPVDNFPPSCLCQSQDNRCGFSVVPVPPGYKVVLMRNNRLSNFEREELRDKYLILASDTAQGFARVGFLPGDNTDKIIEILEINSKIYGGDTIRLPGVSYIRINDQVWVWITKSLPRPAAERWRTAPTMRGAALALTGVIFTQPLTDPIFRSCKTEAHGK